MSERRSQCQPPTADQMAEALERWETEGGALGALRATSARRTASQSCEDATGGKTP
jgi:hypothetical protein